MLRLELQLLVHLLVVLGSDLSLVEAFDGRSRLGDYLDLIFQMVLVVKFSKI